MPEANHPDLTALLARIERLEEEFAKTRDLLALAHAEIKRMYRIIEGLQHRLFGPSPEKLDPAQLQLKLDELVLGRPASPPDKRWPNIRTGGGKAKCRKNPPHQG